MSLIIRKDRIRQRLIKIIDPVIRFFRITQKRVRWIMRWHKFKEGDWIYEKHCVAKVLAVGWNQYQLKMYTHKGIFIFNAPQKMAERVYKKVDKKHLHAVMIIYE